MTIELNKIVLSLPLHTLSAYSALVRKATGVGVYVCGCYGVPEQLADSAVCRAG